MSRRKARTLVFPLLPVLLVACGDSGMPSSAEVRSRDLGAAPSRAAGPTGSAALSLTPGTPSLAVGDTVRLSAAGTAITADTKIYWYSSAAAIATVETWTGKVTARAAGAARIYGVAQAADYPVASVPVMVTTAPPAPAPAPAAAPAVYTTVAVAAAPTVPIAITPSSLALAVGDTVRATAAGTKVTANVAVYWYSGDASVMTVEPWTGKVTARGVGTTRLYGAAQTTGYPLASVAVSVTAAVAAAPVAPSTAPLTADTAPSLVQPSTTMLAAPAELPRTYVNLSVPTPTRTISVPAGGNLQTALNNAQPGDVILLAAGASYVGNFVLPAKATSGWITVRTAASDAALPASGVRMTPSYAAQLPKILTYNSAPAIATARGAANWRLLGVEIGAASSVSMVYNLVAFGEGSTTLQTSLSQVPTNIILERSWVHGSATMEVRRCVALNSAHTAIVDSYFTDCHGNQGDSQAIYGWNGPGPFKITNNYLEGGHEVVGFGGPTPGIAGLIPSDIEVRRNHITRPLTWKGRWGTKNLFECKSCQRVLIEGNVLENNWVDQQAGFAILLQGLSDGGDALQNRIWDVTVRSNIIRNTAQGIALASRIAYTGSLPTNPARRISLQNNLILLGDGATYAGDRRQLQVLGDIYDLSVTNNTFGGASVVSNIVFDGAPTSALSLVENVFGPAVYGLVGNGTMGAGTLTRYAPNGQTAANAFVGMPAAGMPSGNWFPATLADAGLLGTLSGDWSISSGGTFGSLLRTNTIGVNFTALASATNGVVR